MSNEDSPKIIITPSDLETTSTESKITIEPSDLETKPRVTLKDLNPDLKIIIDSKGKLISVFEGVPDFNKEGFPSVPYVFKVDNLYIGDDNHEFDEDMTSEPIHNVQVIVCHGERSNGTWCFRDGQSITEVVNGYNEYAEENHIPPIEFIVACDNRDVPKDGLEVRGGEFDTNKITFSMGQPVRGLVYINQKGEVGMNAFLKQGKFWGLDELIARKQIKVDEPVLRITLDD